MEISLLKTCRKNLPPRVFAHQTVGSTSRLRTAYIRAILVAPRLLVNFSCWEILLWRAGGDIGRDVQQVLFAELGNNWLHQIDPYPVARALLHVVHLPDQVAWRTPCNPGHWAEALQIRAVADDALGGFARSCGHQSFSLLDAADRCVGNEDRPRVETDHGHQRFMQTLPNLQEAKT